MSAWRNFAAASARLLGLQDRGVAASGGGASAADALAYAEALAADGRILDAIAYATEQNRRFHDGTLEWRLVQWRREAFASLGTPVPRPDWPPALPDPFPGLQGLPEIAADELTAEIMGGSILHHGCLVVRGLLTKPEAEHFVEGIDKALEACADSRAGASMEDTLPWYAQTPIGDDPSRDFLYPRGVLTAESPRMLFELLELFQKRRIIQVIGEYLGERPALSVKKCTLRKVPVIPVTSWHQDGAFLGSETRTVNAWVALSHCGVDAPSLDIVPRRIPYVVQTGSHGSFFDWAVGDKMVEIAAEGTPVIMPVFEPGDAVLFDHLFLHRTGVRPDMSTHRYAIESWFFAPSTYPHDRLPLVI